MRVAVRPGPEAGAHARAARLRRVLIVWDLSLREAAAMFRVPTAEFATWCNGAVPPERFAAVDDLLAATLRLERRVPTSRVSVVVRRPAPALGGRSLVELARHDGPCAVRAYLRDAAGSA